VLVWRISLRTHARKAFSGEGASLEGGRWNPPGTAVVYTSGTLALATLELLVNISPEDLPLPLVAISAEIAASVGITRIKTAALPKNWRQYPAPAMLQEIGSEWVNAGEFAVLDVPSAVIPRESNFLLNPAHPQFEEIAVGTAELFDPDSRLKRSDTASGKRR
jgi:RES domain-containing protein